MRANRLLCEVSYLTSVKHRGDSADNWCIDRSLCDKSTKFGTNDR